MDVMRIITLIVETGFIIAIFFWTLAIGAQNALQFEAKVREFCGDNVNFKVDGFGNLALQTRPQTADGVIVP